MAYSKKLYKSNDDKVISGVLGGLGEYFDVDPVLIRVGYIFLTVFSAVIPGIITYILMALVVPNQPENIVEEEAKVI